MEFLDIHNNSASWQTAGWQTVQYVIGLARENRESEVHTMSRDVLCITAKGKPVKAKTLGQKRYMEAIRKNTIVMGVGPAGTGKTYLAVAAAVAAFRDKQVSRIILTRPAVEAGEKLGFLPGDLQSKVRLKSGNEPVKNIALSLGFNNISFFNKFFKQHTGITPHEYRGH